MAATQAKTSASHALDELYREHVAEVYRYAYAVLGNHADAEDVTQTTFVNALRALEQGERPRKPSNWLVTITHNIVRQRFRQQQARPTEVELDRDVAQEPADTSGPSMDELVRALQRIPPSQREAIVMRELEGRSYGEIAKILDLSAGALETLLFRARRSLADELENVVTCDRAELGLSKQLDGRLSRKERKRLDDHIAECPSCARLQVTQGRHRRAFKGLALVPLPLSLTLFEGVPAAAAAGLLPTIGTAAAVGGGVAAGGGAGGMTLGGLALGGIAVKTAAVVAAVSVAGGVGYVGTKEVQDHRSPAKPPATHVSKPAATSSPSETSAPKQAAAANRSAAAKSLARARRNASAPGASGLAHGTNSKSAQTKVSQAGGVKASARSSATASHAKMTQPVHAKVVPARAKKPVAPASHRGTAPKSSIPLAKPHRRLSAASKGSGKKLQ